MLLDQIRTTSPDTRLLARDSLATTQWEAALAAGPDRADAAVWRSPVLLSRSRWLSDAWETARASASAAHDYGLLSALQTDALWRRVIDESDEADWLIGTQGIAGWVRTARQGLFEHGLDPAAERASAWNSESAIWLDWNRRFDVELAQHGWIDPESLLYRFNRLPLLDADNRLVLLDPPPATPEWIRFEQRWRERGGSIDSLLPARRDAVIRMLLPGDQRSELECAVDWAQTRLARHPEARLAIVVPDLDERSDEINRLFSEGLGSLRLSSTSNRPISDIAIFGAALAALELLGSSARFGHVSRWLRSPFFPPELDRGHDRRIALEGHLRDDARAQQPFVEAYRRHGLRQLFERYAPETMGRLERALERLPRRAEATAWAQCFQAALKDLGWRGFDADLSDALHDSWDNVWKQFSMLTPVLGALDPAAATRELSRIARAVSVHQPLSLHGVHLFRRIAQIGPGYDGAWIMGFSDSNWPEPKPLNPLIPWSIQALHDMPGAVPERRLAAARVELENVLARVPEAVFSCPKRIADQPQVPNPGLSGWEAAECPPAGGGHGRAGYAAGRRASRGWETVADPAPAFAERRIPGGAATLKLQAADPAQAFCVARLNARPLRSPTRGIDARLRGLLLHRVLEILLTPGREDAAASLLQPTIDRVFAESIARGDERWDQLVSAEKERTRLVLERFLALEAERTAFVTLEVERRIEVDIAGRILTGRIDRRDRLDGGRSLLIDYKTGKQSSSGWFKERLSDPQLPLYAQLAGESPDAIVIVALGTDGVAYRAAGIGVEELPGRQHDFEPEAWLEQLERWRQQLVDLVEEFTRGDVRVRVDDGGRAGREFAVLTRSQDARQ